MHEFEKNHFGKHFWGLIFFSDMRQIVKKLTTVHWGMRAESRN
jgi:hypothetical protein